MKPNFCQKCWFLKWIIYTGIIYNGCTTYIYKNCKLILTNYYYISITNTLALQINKKHARTLSRSRHKRVHGLKLQNIALLNGMIGNLTGPYEEQRHDSFMLAESGFLAQLQQHACFGNRPLSIYGILHTLLAFIWKHHLEVHILLMNKIVTARPWVLSEYL